MTDGKRVCIAAIAFVGITHRMISVVHDINSNNPTRLGIRCFNRLYNVFDYSRSGYIGGYLPNLFDYISGYHIQLTIDGNNFKGFDYETATYYSGHYSGLGISIYDFEHNQYYSYKMQ